ncbi:MAG: helix-turn-helix transcriptional regulator [Nitrospinae bacterium]|nr:helix-turn-helix transcriptional regulator [Nitrospinota bacterium]
MSVLARNIRLIRKELRCTQSVMSEILKVGFRTYVRYEAGERDAPVSVLVKLARLGNISLEQLLTTEVGSHDIALVPVISQAEVFPETKMVNFRKGQIVFKKPVRQELITIDASEKRLLTLFRKMDVDLQKVCVENIQETIKSGSSAPALRTLRLGAARRKPGRPPSSGTAKRGASVKKKGRPGRKKVNKKLLKEKIDRLKIITKSISKITVR